MAILKTYTISTDVTGAAVNSELLHSELVAAGDITNFTGININGDSLEVWGDSFITEANVDTTVLAHVEVPLSSYKTNKYNAIDAKTGYLVVSAGFTYDGVVFSTSLNAQKNWSDLKYSKSTFTFPKNISTKAHGTYALAEANVDAFWLAGKDVIDPLLDAGRALIQAITDAANEAAVDAVVDNR